VETERLLSLATQAQATFAQGDAVGATSILQRLMQDADVFRTRVSDPAAKSIAAQARSQRARIDYEDGHLEAALQGLREAAQILSASGAQGVDPAELARIRSEQAEMLLELGQHTEALGVQEGVVTLLQQTTPASPETRRSHAAALARRGDMRLAAHRDLPQASNDYLQARAILTELLAEDGARTDFKRDLSLTHERAGDAFLQAGDIPRARDAFAACLALRRELVARNRANAEWRRDLSVALERVAGVHALERRRRDAEAVFAEALTLRQATFDSDPSDIVHRRDLAVLWMRMGQARTVAQATLADVNAAYSQAIELLTPLVDKASADSRWRRDLAVAYAERGEARRRAGQRAQALADFAQALARIEALRLAAPDDEQLAQDQTWLRQRLPR
jgi:tetratricopeptide (TPR) repeat protein